MREPGSRRLQKKAQTRAALRETAQRLFDERGFDAVTVVDIAGAAGVAVQTVFNHFTSKEELFFDGRTPWVAMPAEVVRNRPPQTPPLTALRQYTRLLVGELVTVRSAPERRAYISIVDASPALRSHELNLLEQSEQLLAAALAEAWQACPATAPGGGTDEAQVQVAAAMCAALWVSAARTLVRELRRSSTGPQAEPVRAAVELLAERVFDRLEYGLEDLLEISVAAPGPPSPVRRAG